MPIVIDGGRVPKLLALKGRARSGRPASKQTDYIRIALINNMPDSALEDTEIQFCELLDTAAGDIPISLKLFSLPELPRSDGGQRHLNNFYFDINELLNGRFDGVIMTGTEPRQPDLRDEPYWPVLAKVLDWAETNTASTVLSCLAAHAGVLHSDGILRHRLSDKKFGVFEYQNIRDHALTAGGENAIRIPHSRWNEVRADALRSCGYEVLLQSAQAGVDLFVKKKRDSLFVHFQGHPEYGTRTLLKECRRDIKRFLRKERETYPNMPLGYFDAAAAKLVSDFQEIVIADPGEKLLAKFPEAALVDAVQGTWHASAAMVYRNWLKYLQLRKADPSALSAMTPVARA